MDKVKGKIISVDIGRFDINSALVEINDKNIQYCFPKNIDIEKYLGKEVYLYSDKNGHNISELKLKKDKKTKEETVDSITE